MKEEELIKKLESINLPKIEIESHRCRLRTGLLNSEYFREQQRAGVFSQAKSKMKDLFSWRPVWKPALVSTLAIALIVGSALLVPSLFGPPPEVMAAEIAQNNPEVQKLLGDDCVTTIKVQLVDGKGLVVCEASIGTFALVNVDLEKKEVVKAEKIKMPELTEEEKERAVEIAKADPGVQELLDKGASIDKVFPMFGMIGISEKNGEMKIETSVTVAVAVTLDDEKWIVLVNLDEGKVERILKPGSSATSRMYGGEVEGAIKEKEYEINIITIMGDIHPPSIPPITEEEKAEIINIAKADPEVQELLAKGAEINENFMFWSYKGPIASQGEDKITLGEMSKDKANLILELKENGEAIKSWIVTIDPTTEKVVGMEPVLIATRVGDWDPPKPSFSPSPPPEELIDMIKTDSRVQELLDKGARVIGAASSGDKVSVILELDEGDRWVVKIDLATEKVVEVEPMHEVELGYVSIFGS